MWKKISGLVLLVSLCQGCEATRAYVRIGEPARTYKMYMFERRMTSSGQGTISYGAGDNREAFRPAIYAPYAVPATWYMSFREDGEQSSFQFVGEILGGSTEPDAPAFRVYAIENPQWATQEDGTIEGSGYASVTDFTRGLQAVSADTPQEQVPVSFRVAGARGFLPLAPPAGVMELMSYEPPGSIESHDEPEAPPS